MKKIAVAGTGYVGLSMVVLLAQHHQVIAVDIVPEKVDLINAKKSPIQDKEIEEFLASKELHLKATLDAESAYQDADFVIVAAPTNYDSKRDFLTRRLLKLLLKQFLLLTLRQSLSLNQRFQ
ncbi:3-hydroxyacyl-CoA dehydrogenase NAD-binding domain-containing protein [Streptococcus iniae]